MISAVRSLSRFVAQAVQRTLGTDDYLSMQIDITNHCNLSCKHCYHPHHDNEGALDFDGWCKVLDEYDRLREKLCRRPHIIFCGGEPFSSPLLDRLVKEIYRRDPETSISVLTNGTLIRKSRLTQFNPNKTDFQISFDGPDAPRHDAIRGAGNFARAIGGVRTLQESGFNPVLLAVLSLRSAPWIADFFKLANEFNVTAMNFTRFVGQGEGRRFLESGNDRSLDPLELKSALSEIAALSRQSGVYSETGKPLFNLVARDLGYSGMFGFQGIVLDYKGRMKVSSRSDVVLGDVLTEGLESIFFNHPMLRDLRDGKVETCGSCPHYKKCGGDRNAAYAEFGNFLARDPGCWLDHSKTKEFV